MSVYVRACVVCVCGVCVYVCVWCVRMCVVCNSVWSVCGVCGVYLESSQCAPVHAHVTRHLFALPNS